MREQVKEALIDELAPGGKESAWIDCRAHPGCTDDACERKEYDMSLLQTGSTLHNTSNGLMSSGPTQLVYGRDGCEQKTGDPYARIAFVVRDSGDEEWDESEIQGWTFTEAGSYCPACSGNEDEAAPQSPFYLVPRSALRPIEELRAIMDAERKSRP